MKKWIFLLAMVLSVNTFTHAQYKINKTKYDYRTYKYQPGDLYNPTITALASLWIPGLGQMTAGETKRGLTFLFAGATPVLVYFIAAFGQNTNSKSFTTFGNTILPVYIAGIAIWSCVDGVRVAKVNNLAWRDKYKTSSHLQLVPYIEPSWCNPEGQLVTGITLKFEF